MDLRIIIDAKSTLIDGSVKINTIGGVKKFKGVENIESVQQLDPRSPHPKHIIF